ncbi:hypothetical protein RFI_01824, partial [Reticulomyxa filosa]
FFQGGYYSAGKVLTKLHDYACELSKHSSILNLAENVDECFALRRVRHGDACTQVDRCDAMTSSASNMNAACGNGDDDDGNDKDLFKIKAQDTNTTSTNLCEETNHYSVLNFDSRLDGLSLSVALLSELLLIAKNRESDFSWSLNRETIREPLHVDLSMRVLTTLTDILDLSYESYIVLLFFFFFGFVLFNVCIELLVSSTKESVQQSAQLLVSHTLSLIKLQMTHIDTLKVKSEHLTYPFGLTHRLKAKLFSIIRQTVSDTTKPVPDCIRKIACQALAQGQKLFFPAPMDKLFYLLALYASRNGWTELSYVNDYFAKRNKSTIVSIHEITKLEVDTISPILLKQLQRVSECSFLVESALTSSSQSLQFFFDTLQVLLKMFSKKLHESGSEKESFDILQLMYDLQIVLTFGYERWMREQVKDNKKYLEEDAPLIIQMYWQLCAKATKVESDSKEEKKMEQKKEEKIPFLQDLMSQYINTVITISQSILSDLSSVGVLHQVRVTQFI